MEFNTASHEMSLYRERYQMFMKHANLKHQQHQEDGMIWCINKELEKQHNQSIHGGIVADEMGCGKTFMMISLIICHFVPRTLVVVPLPLMKQWSDAIYQSCGHRPLLYYGHRIQQYNAKKEIFMKAPIVITTYGVVSHQVTNTESPLFTHTWNRIIYDEAHHMRNKNTLKYTAGNKLQSTTKWLLTGTPIQNSMTDLYTLCRIIGLQNPIRMNPDDIQSMILRRTKKDVGICLPDMTVTRRVISWKNPNEKMVARILHEMTTDVVPPKKMNMIQSDEKGTRNVDAECIDDVEAEILKEEEILQEEHLMAEEKIPTRHLLVSEKQREHECSSSGEQSEEIYSKTRAYFQNVFGGHPLQYYLRCRQICVCPKLLDKLLSNVHKSNLHDTQVIENGLVDVHKIHTVVKDLVKNDFNGNKKIVFCTFRHEMDILKEELEKEKITDVAIYDGRLSRYKRNHILEKQHSILIMQIQMGCEGLNLQYANEVYFVGSLWNPAVEDQAIGRCFRMGQTKMTHVYKYCMASLDDDTNSHEDHENSTLHSMDEYMNHVATAKRTMQESFM